MMAASFDGRSQTPVGPPRSLFSFEYRDLALLCLPIRCYDVMPDGNGFYSFQVLPTPPVPPVTHIELVQNWTQELRTKLPVER
jgi:hypothetical protein